jgi:hypothetical protein
LPILRSVYSAVAYRKKHIGFYSSVRHWLQVPKVLIAPLPIAVCSE